MSLIQDALKRQSEERPGVPPPVIPAEPPAPAAGKNNRPRLLVILTVVLIAVLTGLGIYLIKPNPKNIPVVIPPPAPAAPVAPIAAPQPVTPPEPPVQMVETTKVETVVDPVKKEEPAPEKPIEWPELNLTGIAQSDNQSLAVINGKMLSAGRTMGKVTIREVTPTNVVVEYQGERRILYIGE